MTAARFGVIYNEPFGVALLQTAGLLVGGWLFAAGFRGRASNNRIAEYTQALKIKPDFDAARRGLQAVRARRQATGQ